MKLKIQKLETEVPAGHVRRRFWWCDTCRIEAETLSDPAGMAAEHVKASLPARHLVGWLVERYPQ